MILPADIDAFTLVYNYGTYCNINKIKPAYNVYFLPREFLNMTQLEQINFRLFTSDNRIYSYYNSLTNHNFIKWKNLVNINIIMGISSNMINLSDDDFGMASNPYLCANNKS